MSVEIPLQKDMFTHELVDTRTEKQIKADRLKDQPVQQDLFRHIPINEFRAKRTPLAGDYRPKLVLIQEKSCTDEQIEEEIDRQAQERTRQMFAEAITVGQVEEDEAVRDVEADETPAIPQPLDDHKEQTYMELVKLVEECKSTVEVDSAYGQSLLIRLSLARAKIQVGILKPAEATAAIVIGKSLAKQPQPEVSTTENTSPAVTIPIETDTDKDDLCAVGFRIQQRRKQMQIRGRKTA